MPITQERMIEQMQEARAAHTAFVQLREQMLTICDNAKRRYHSNEDLRNVLDAIIAHVQLQPTPNDRATYINEQHYRRHAKHNRQMRERQEIARRMAGIPTVDEAMAILQAKNALRRADLPTTSQSYERPKIPNAIADPFAAIGHTPELIPTYRERPAASSRPSLIIPDDSDEPPLEFDLPPGATLGENNLNIPLDMGHATSEDDGPSNEGE